MRGMFAYAAAFNQDINTKEVTRSDGTTYVAWDVSQVKNMRNMFKDATAFNKNIGEWNVSQVKDMQNMFAGATSFNQDIGQWPIRSICNTYKMFFNSGVSAKTFTGIYGNKIADYFDLKNPDEDTVMEPYTRWERRKNAVTLMSELNKNIDILNSKEEKLGNIFDSNSIGRKIVLFI